jgi:hypothetical protein
LQCRICTAGLLSVASQPFAKALFILAVTLVPGEQRTKLGAISQQYSVRDFVGHK